MPASDWLPNVAAWLRAGRNLLYPTGCLVCRKEAVDDATIDDAGPPICAVCLTSLSPTHDILCRLCGGERIAPPANPGDPCEQCRTHEHPFDAVVAYGAYRELLRECVLRIKHPEEEYLARALGNAFYARRRGDFALFQSDVVVPIPMHWWRRYRRGTNVAETLGATLAERLGLPFARGLKRVRMTTQLGELSATVRRKTLKHAFALRRGVDYRGARVLLVDDILTSGATCDEATRTLLKAGAASVVVVVLARAQRRGFRRRGSLTRQHRS
ncbi:MAG: phosphoribosyltransferase family protein [Pirellulales bacterium]